MQLDKLGGKFDKEYVDKMTGEIKTGRWFGRKSFW